MKPPKRIDRKAELRTRVEQLQQSLRYCRIWMASHPKPCGAAGALIETQFRNLKRMLATAKFELKEESKTLRLQRIQK